MRLAAAAAAAASKVAKANECPGVVVHASAVSSSSLFPLRRHSRAPQGSRFRVFVTRAPPSLPSLARRRNGSGGGVSLATKTAISGGDDDADEQESSPSFFAGVPDAAPSGSLKTEGAGVFVGGSSSEAKKSDGAAGSEASASSSASASEPDDPVETFEILSSVAGWTLEASRIPAAINFLRFGKAGKKRETRRDRLQKLREAAEAGAAAASASSSAAAAAVAEGSSSEAALRAFVDLLDELNRGGDHDEVIARASDPLRCPDPLPEEAAAAYLEALVRSGRLRGDYVLPRAAPAGAALLPAPGTAHASLPLMLSELSGRVVGDRGDDKGGSGAAAPRRVPLPGRSPSRPIHVAVYSPSPLSPSSSSLSSLSRGAAAAAAETSPSPSSAGLSILQSVVRSVATLLCLGTLFVIGAGVARRQAYSSWQQQQHAVSQQQSQSPSSQQQQQQQSSQQGSQNPFGSSSSNNPLAGSSPTSAAAGGGYAPKEYNGEDVPEQSKVRFSDVKGVDEAKAELAEVVDFLKSPHKFRSLGGKLPKGVLLSGPPGTGKTLLARAVAGEAGVPFFFRAGSEFEEMFVGVGARRARALFAAAKKAAPCIVFIDEIDAVGGNRRAWENHSRKTLNQLLVEMDGFEPTEGVIVIAATNAADTLDPALVRPGRFDRTVAVPLPDVRGRLEILTHYLRSKPLARDEAEAAERAAENERREAAEAVAASAAAAAANAGGGGGRLIPSLQGQQQQQQQQQPWGRGSIWGPQGGSGSSSSNNGGGASPPSSPFPTLLSASPPPASTSSPSPPLPPPIQTVDLPLLAGTLARRTPGFSGAQLASMVNEAALLAARRGLGALTPRLLDEARDKVLMGTERRSLVQSAVNRRLTAYHEAGHALVASVTKGARPIHKATIVPRGHALGMVAQLPDGDETSVSRLQLRAEVDVALGGMAAENLVFGADGVTTGARSDLRQATRVARHMIAECGMSEAVGPRFVDAGDSGGSGGSGSSSSANPDTVRLVDAEVGAFLREARDRVAALLKQREGDLHRLAGALLEHETLTGEDVAAVLDGSFSKAPPVSGGGRGGSGTATKEEKEVLAALGVDVDGIGDMARVNKRGR
jgi:ATP-dependent Zn protease